MPHRPTPRPPIPEGDGSGRKAAPEPPLPPPDASPDKGFVNVDLEEDDECKTGVQDVEALSSGVAARSSVDKSVGGVIYQEADALRREEEDRRIQKAFEYRKRAERAVRRAEAERERANYDPDGRRAAAAERQRQRIVDGVAGNGRR